MLQFVNNQFLSLQMEQREKKLELQKAKKLNEELKTKLKKLKKENKDLKEKFDNNEIDIATRKNDLNNLLETLQRERRAVLEVSQRLHICKEKIDSISSFIEKMKPIKEKLNFKDSVSECLHDLLVKTKLRIAESDEILQELHDFLSHLEYNVEKTREVQKQGFRQWHDEFLAARIREADVILEFDKLKREIAIIKNEFEEVKLIDDAQKIARDQSNNTPAKETWSKDQEKYRELLIHEQEILLAKILEFQNEIDMLRQEERKLECLIQDYKKKMKSNEEIKVHLSEVRRSIWLREFETTRKIVNLKEEYTKLTNKMNNELRCVQESIEEKDLVVARIEEEIKKLQEKNDILEKELKNSPSIDPTVNLEEEKANLEKQIIQLNKN
ncbi:hypothetical protein ABEB36_007463 [Hypothenemus hampei]|uniref:Uncharacterized protein n=1 Tax=Hypothenemus hampei TaxID=57062 RepID=A0ABD1EU11_HYPHA